MKSNQDFKIGVVIADEQEYKPVRNLAKSMESTVRPLYGDELTVIMLRKGGQALAIYFVLCGIGKVNAAAATAYLITEGVQAVVNSGLSGGISGIRCGEITLGDRFLEHDFDLSPLGLKQSVKPQETSVYTADAALNRLFLQCSPQAKIGTMACGDRFISDTEQKDWLIGEFNAMSCDMESAAVASVCHKAGIPFAALRRISDDAGDDAQEAYREMNDQAQSTLIDLILDGMHILLDNPAFFQRKG